MCYTFLKQRERKKTCYSKRWIRVIWENKKTLRIVFFMCVFQSSNWMLIILVACLQGRDSRDRIQWLSLMKSKNKRIFCDLLSAYLGALLVKLFQYYKWSFVKFLYEDNPKPWHECQVLLRPIAHTFASHQIRSDNRKVTNHDINDKFRSIFQEFISNNASGT